MASNDTEDPPSTIPLQDLDDEYSRPGSLPSVRSLTPPRELIPGYPKLGGRMGLVPEMAMFRRFGALNSQVLLYMQSELIHLESELRELELEDSCSSQPYKSKYSRDYFFLHNPTTPGDDRQLRLVMEIKTKLKEYS